MTTQKEHASDTSVEKKIGHSHILILAVVCVCFSYLTVVSYKTTMTNKKIELAFEKAMSKSSAHRKLISVYYECKNTYPYKIPLGTCFVKMKEFSQAAGLTDMFPVVYKDMTEQLNALNGIKHTSLKLTPKKTYY